MADSSATLRMSAVDRGMVDTLNQVSAQTTNLQIAGAATTATLKGLSTVSSTSSAQLAIGARQSNLLATNLDKVAIGAGKVTRVLGNISLGAFYLQQLGTAVDGVAKASERAVRLPTTLRAMQSSGVSTAIIADFNNMQLAIRGNELAIEDLVANSISKLNAFEAAATRAGTILKSSINVDDQGNPLRANQQERFENALQTQKLVNEELKNSVTSTRALVGQYDVLSSGFTKTAESQEVLLSGLKLIGIAEAGGLSADTSQTVQLLTKTLNAYELSSADAARTAGILNGVVENGLTTIQQLSLGFGSTAKQAKEANISLIDLGSSVSVLTSQGTSTPLALTGISRVAASIIDKTPEAEKELAKLQLRGERIRFDKAEIQAKGFTQALVDLNEAAGGSPEILSKIFPEQVAFRTVTALLAERGKRLQDTRVSIAKADSKSLDEVFEIAQSDRTKRFERLSNRIEESIIKVGTSLAPTLEPGIKVLEGIADRFERLPEPIKELLGQYIALQVRTKAYGGAASILVKTLGSLAANYLLIRTISLALTGQLGNEINTIKALISQRKGLAAATLQLFGINQKWRLAETAATETITQQTAAAKGLAAARAKVGTATKKAATTVVTSAVAVTSGVSRETVGQQLAQRKAQAGAVLSEVGRRGKEIGSALVDKAKEGANKAAENLGVQPFFAPTPQRPTPRPVVPVSQLPPPPPKPASGAFARTATGAAIPAPPPAPPPGALVKRPTTSQDYLTLLAKEDTQVKQALEQQIKLEDELTLAKKKRGKIGGDISALTKKREQELLKLSQARQKAIKVGTSATASATEREKALNAVKKQRGKIDAINNKIDDKRLEYTKANTTALVARNRVTAATIKTQEAQTAAAVKFKPLAEAYAKTNALSIKYEEARKAATLARIQAEEIALAQGAKSQAAIVANAKARRLEAVATKAQEVASISRAKASAIENSLLTQQRLTEQGLFKAKLFGRDVILAQSGAVGGLNKLLITNISLTGLATLAEKAFAKARLITNNILDIRNLQLAKENILLATKNVKSFTGAFTSLVTGAAGKAGSLITGLTGSLGLLSPLLITAAGAAIIFRRGIFGLGKEVRQLNKEYKKLIIEQQILEKRLGFEKAGQGLDKAVASNNIVEIRRELVGLKNESFITEKEFGKLNKKFPELSEGAELSEKRLASFRKELRQLKTDVKEVEKGVVESFFGKIKSIPSGIGKVFDFTANSAGALVTNILTPSFDPADRATRQSVKLAREYDALIKPLSILNNLQGDLSDRYISTTKAIISYRENLALTREVQERVAGGFRLTDEDLKLEEKQFKALEERNNKQIAIAESLIKKSEDALAKTENEETQNLLASQIAQARIQKEGLQEQNQGLRELRSQIKKYLTEELPAIRQALQEQSDPQLLFENAKEAYQDIFIDEEGKILKPLDKLRDEAFKLVNAVNEGLSQGLFDLGGETGESRAASQLREIRDETISFYEDGELKQGYRLAIADRRALTEQIVALENADLKRQEQNAQLEIARLRAKGRLQFATETEIAVQTSRFQEQQVKSRIALKEAEIQELQRLGLRTVKQETELVQLQLEAESARATTLVAAFNERIAKLQLRTNQTNQIVATAIAESQKIAISLGQELQLTQQILSANQARLGFSERNLEIQQQVTSNSVFNATNQVRLAQERLVSLQSAIPLQEQQLDTEIKITKEQNQQALLQSRIQKAQAKINLDRAKGRLQLAIANDATQDRLTELKLEQDRAELELERANSRVDQANFAITLEERISEQKREQLRVSTEQNEISAQTAINIAAIAESEARIQRETSLQSAAVSVRGQFLQLQKNQLAESVNNRTQELNLAAQLTNSEKEKNRIARNTAALKLRSLKQQLQLDAEILANNQRQAQIQQQRDKALNQSKLSQNFSEILDAQANLQKLQAGGASPQEIAAAEAKVNAELAERQSILLKEQQLKQKDKLLGLEQKQERVSFERRSGLEITKAQVEALGLLEGNEQERRRKQLLNELLGSSATNNQNLGSAIDSLSRVEIKVPKLEIPKIEIPSIEDISKDIRAMIQEFNVPQQTNNISGGKTVIIESLVFRDTAINNTVTGDDTEEIVDQVEERIFNSFATTISTTDFESLIEGNL